MKITTILRKIVIVLLFISLFILGSFFLLAYMVERYHQGTIDKQISILQELKRDTPSKEQIKDLLGPPWHVLNSAEALDLSRAYFPRDETVRKSIKYPMIMFYYGLPSFFIFLNDEGKMVAFTVVRG